MRHPLVDSRQYGRTTNMWPSKCTIKSVIITLSDSNQEIESGTTAIPSMTDIQCILGPVVDHPTSDNEVRTSAIITGVLKRVCKLNGHFTEIIARTHKAVVDNIVYNIRGVEHDYTGHSTRLTLEIIKP